MANFKFTKIRDIGLIALVQRCIPRRPLCRFTREGCYLPPLFLTERHSFATAPQPHLRGVPITRAKRKRQNHFNFSLSRVAIGNRRPMWSPRYPSARLKPAVSREGVL